MKRCPQCSRLETDDALKFCRVDGATLINDSSAIGSEFETAQFGSAPTASETATSILPNTTAANARSTAPTAALPSEISPTATNKLPKRTLGRNLVIGVILLVVIAGGAGAIGSWYLARRNTAAIQSIAVMPFVNA